MRVRIEVQGIVENTPENRAAMRIDITKTKSVRRLPGFPYSAKTESQEGDFLMETPVSQPVLDSEGRQVLDINGNVVMAIPFTPQPVLDSEGNETKDANGNTVMTTFTSQPVLDSAGREVKDVNGNVVMTAALTPLTPRPALDLNGREVKDSSGNIVMAAPFVARPALDKDGNEVKDANGNVVMTTHSTPRPVLDADGKEVKDAQGNVVMTTSRFWNADIEGNVFGDSNDRLLNTRPKLSTDEKFLTLDVEPKATIRSILAEAKIAARGRYVTLNNNFVGLDTPVIDEDSYILLKLRK